ncbi:MAG: cupin domain-containing protein [Balneolaceae bacterium]|nr:cupin domain-containing protein [Balneolaceae bacterium]MDR9410394.1 cupin domain-containing protein [Balneolaceae bacterium]
MQPESFFIEDDGSIPNNRLPLLIYRDVFTDRDSAGARWFENKFKQNNWYNSWRNGVFSYHHYHSNTHEVLGVYSGSAKLLMGGESGIKVDVSTGDVIIIPAGVGHKNLGSSRNFGVVGAYPNGSGYDLKTGKQGERPQADKNISEVPVPSTDPLQGTNAGLPTIWNDIEK